jgi:probable addiction module antidote protein
VEIQASLALEGSRHRAALTRESLYKALSGDRSPGFGTTLKVIDALGLELRAEAGHSR